VTAGSRREARERALELLYEAAAKDTDPRDVLAELVVPPDELTEALVAGVAADAPAVDALLTRHVRGDWPLDRLATVDRLVLRLGAWELEHRTDTPTAVVLSEAVELAVRYSTEESGRFVNGVLAAVAADVRPGPAPAPGLTTGP
jgi:N utilization substance protein B